MHIHILGICGTFMGGLAAIAKTLGHRVTGADKNVYPPMSTQLQQLGIALTQGYDPAQFDPVPDMVVIGNAMSRGNPAVEFVLEHNIPYTSGPQWLLENLLKDCWVLAVAGTHGKTTTASMLAWILDYADMQPGFLIGGIPQNFAVSARVGKSPFFVIEADEYDSAFFDKRSKFVHYHPRTLVLNNLEFDHADIFADLAAIEKQFHHLIRTVPAGGLVISPKQDESIQRVLAMGCWSEQQQLGDEWQVRDCQPDGSRFTIVRNQQQQGQVSWELMGQHNINNAMMAVAAAHHVGVPVALACEALSAFINVKRRMEIRGQVNNITLYDDFAHHPSAIATTLDGLRAKVADQRILAVLEPRSNTMKLGGHNQQLAECWAKADACFLYEPEGLAWSTHEVAAQSAVPVEIANGIEDLIELILSQARSGDHIVIMSNGGFGNIHNKLLARLEHKYAD